MIRRLAVCVMLAAGMTAFMSAGVASAQETTWESPPTDTQLQMDPTIVPIGKGSIFCPYMTDPDREPVYGVLNENGDLREDAPMGTRIPLEPGVYTVVIGSGTTDQMLQRRVRVEEGATTLIRPDWAGLVVEVISTSRTPIREYYELYNLDSGISYGIGQGVEEGMDERIITWIVPPGRYKVVKAGGNISDITNFGTIRVLPGELAHANLVINTASGDFLGFGYVADIRQSGLGSSLWDVRSELSGSALLYYTPSSETGGETNASFTSTVQWLTDARYESGRHIIPVWSNFEEGLSMESDRVLRKYVDDAEIRLTYIYRFLDILSPYVRLTAETSFFPTHHRFSEPTDYVHLSAAGDTLKVVRGAEDIKLSGAFNPLYLKEGFGVTSIIFRSLPVNINLRTGYGMRRIISKGSLIFNSDTNVLSDVTQTETTGMEFLLLGDFRIGSFIILNTEFDLLMPERERDRWIYDGENRFRINLTNSVNILVTMEYWKDENVDRMQTRYQTLLRFSRYL